MNGIEFELGLVSNEQQAQIEQLIKRPDADNVEEKLYQLKRLAKMEIYIAESLSRLNQEERPVQASDRWSEAVIYTRQLVRRGIYHSWSYTKDNGRSNDKSYANNTRECIRIYEKQGFITHNLFPPKEIQSETASFIKALDIDLQAIDYWNYHEKYYGNRRRL